MYLVSQPFFNDAVAGTAVQAKNGFAQLFSLRLVNTVAAVAYLQIFFKPAASVTLGTTVPDMVVRLQTSESLAFADFAAAVQADAGVNKGLSFAGTTTPSGNTGSAISVTALFG